MSARLAAVCLIPVLSLAPIFNSPGVSRAAEPATTARRRCFRTWRCLLKNRRQLSQHLVHNRDRNAFQLLAAACTEIERARLVAADNACCFRSGSLQRHGE